MFTIFELNVYVSVQSKAEQNSHLPVRIFGRLDATRRVSNGRDANKTTTSTAYSAPPREHVFRSIKS